MPNGNTPFISQKVVRAGLSALLHAAEFPEGLKFLALVDEILFDPAFPKTQHAREVAVQHLLVNAITDNLDAQRHLFGMSEIDPHESLVTALSHVEEAVQAKSVELVAWSVIYYRYVRFDLNLFSDAFADLLHVDERTYRRYVGHAVRRLTDFLIESEWAARKQQRARRLLAALHAAPATRLVGRAEEFDIVGRALERPGPSHILVTGSSGIGKSAFIHEILRARIENDQIDHLVWIEEPASGDLVKQYVRESLIPEGSPVTSREYLAAYRVAIVLDGISAFEDDADSLEYLLTELSLAEVYVIGIKFVAAANIAAHVSMSELSRSEAEELAQTIFSHLASDPSDSLSSHEFSAIYEAVGGNPEGIKLAVQNLRMGIGQLGDSVERLHQQHYANLPATLKQSWCVLGLIPPNGIDQHDLPAMVASAVEPLRRHHILYFSRHAPARIALSPSARAYVRRLWQSSQDVRGWIDEGIDVFERLISDNSGGVLDILEHILVSAWPDIPVSRRAGWIRALWERGLRQGHHTNWPLILERYLSETTWRDLDLAIALGKCMRRVGEHTGARAVFINVMEAAGRQGRFVEQAMALLELSVLYRYRGQYDRTMLLLGRARKIALHAGSSALQQSIAEEEAWILVEKGDAEGARACLGRFSIESLRTLVLRSEISLLLGEHPASEEFAGQALEHAQGDIVMLARVYDLMGRVYNGQDKGDRAHDCFVAALALLDSIGDPFALARVQSNLGALLVQEGGYDEAYRLLANAEKIQSQFADRAGLLVTLHNLNLLRILTTGN